MQGIFELPRAKKLVHGSLVKRFSELGAQAGKKPEDIIVPASYFSNAGFRWFPFEGWLVMPDKWVGSGQAQTTGVFTQYNISTDPQNCGLATDYGFYGWVVGPEKEFGNFGLHELLQWGPGVMAERDCCWPKKGMRLSEIMARSW